MPEYNNFIKKEGDAYILQGAMMNTVIYSTNDLASLIDRINTVEFQNYCRGLFLLVLKEGCRSRILKASYTFIYNYLFLFFFSFTKVQFSYS